MQVERICERCGEVNNIDSSNLVRQDVYSEDGEYFKVMYCKCKRFKSINHKGCKKTNEEGNSKSKRDKEKR